MRLAPTGGIEPRRRFLIIQIDGLSRGILDRALAGGSMRNTRRLLATGELERRELSVGLPTSTPAFQASIMYGVRPDIPGFHYYDKREGRELHFPERGVADQVEQPALRRPRGHPRGRRLLRLRLHRRRAREPVDLRALEAPHPGRLRSPPHRALRCC